MWHNIFMSCFYTYIYVNFAIIKLFTESNVIFLLNKDLHFST